MSPQRYEDFRVSDIAPYIKLWAESNPNSPENLYQKQLRDIQMKQAILNLQQAQSGFNPQPQATYGDIFGQVNQPTGELQNYPNPFGMGIPTPVPQITQREPTGQEVSQKKSQFFPKTTPDWVKTEEERRFPKTTTYSSDVTLASNLLDMKPEDVKSQDIIKAKEIEKSIGKGRLNEGLLGQARQLALLELGGSTMMGLKTRREALYNKTLEIYDKLEALNKGGGTTKASVAERYNQLQTQGLNDDAIYKQLATEGY